MCKPPLIRFAFVRSILFRTFSAILSPIPVAAELCRQSTAYRSHGRFTRSFSPYWEVSLSSHVSSPFRKAVPNFETSHLSLILSESWRVVSLAAEISYQPCDQRTCRVDILLSSYLELLFSLHLYRGRSLVFNNRFLL